MKVAVIAPTAGMLMRSFPAVGAITALTVLAEVGDFARFPSPEKLAKFAGLIPRQRSSGGTVHYGSITNVGSPYLRTALVETAMRMRATSAPELMTFYENIRPTSGAKRARVALARKLLVIMWAMATKQHAYVPQEPKPLLPNLARTNA
jgi:transposase